MAYPAQPSSTSSCDSSIAHSNDSINNRAHTTSCYRLRSSTTQLLDTSVFGIPPGEHDTVDWHIHWEIDGRGTPSPHTLVAKAILQRLDVLNPTPSSPSYEHWPCWGLRQFGLSHLSPGCESTVAPASLHGWRRDWNIFRVAVLFGLCPHCARSAFFHAPVSNSGYLSYYPLPRLGPGELPPDPGQHG